MSDIDWSKAPEWATKYGMAGPRALHCWLSDEQYVYADDANHHPIRFGDQSAYARERDQFTVIAERPSPAWSGEGLPPVGTVCECMVKANEPWAMCEVVAHHGHYAIAYVDENTVMLSAGIRFRPIRTPEQIAADEREAACEEMLEIAKSRRPDPDVYEAIATLYDAGFRKP